MSVVIENKDCISPYEELLSFEYLFSQRGMTREKLSRLFDDNIQRPSDALRQYVGLLDPDPETLERIKHCIQRKSDYSIQVNGAPLFPNRLSDADNALPIFYYRGNLDLLSLPSVSVVGTRKPSHQGREEADRIARLLVKRHYVIVSGLAKGIDTAAMKAGLAESGNVIGILGTPIDVIYPKENGELQKRVGETGLLVSQVPFYRYETEPFQTHNVNFPARNKTMAAISIATVIVEAGETSGTRSQAHACLKQGRLLIMMDSVYRNNQWARDLDGDKMAIANSPDDVIRILNQESNL